MSYIYANEVLIAVVDTKHRLKVLLERVQFDLNLRGKEIFPNFKWVYMEEDIWAYVFHDPCILWSRDAHNIWRVISNNAKSLHASYIFFRMGNDDTDTESEEYTVDGVNNYCYLSKIVRLERKLVLDERVQSAFKGSITPYEQQTEAA